MHGLQFSALHGVWELRARLADLGLERVALLLSALTLGHPRRGYFTLRTKGPLKLGALYPMVYKP